MIEVVGVYRYPLTGARAEVLDSAMVGPAGLEGDRTLVLYDATCVASAKPRVSQKGNPKLATVDAFTNPLELYIPNYGNFYIPEEPSEVDVIVDEFGDQVPANDMGDRFAARLSQFLGVPGVRLARKAQDWLAGGVTPPALRHNRAIHIVNRATVRAVQARMPESTFGTERFRPSIVVDGEIEAFQENEWLNEQIVIGGVTYAVNALTKRCPVPGYDQRMGRNRKDVPKLYRDLPKADNKPVFGVYAYPLIAIGDGAELTVGMPVAA